MTNQEIFAGVLILAACGLLIYGVRKFFRRNVRRGGMGGFELTVLILFLILTGFGKLFRRR